MMNLPNVHFGKIKDEDVDWRKENGDSEEDSEEISDDVIAMLGFDPRDEK